MQKYQKYFQPEYKDMAPEVHVPEPEIMDFENPRKWRERYTKESAVSISCEMQKCHCYESIMEVETEERRVLSDGIWIPVKMYYPGGKREGKYPMVLFCHGGGFMMNNFDVYEYVCRYIARFGNAVVVIPDYRLAPEYKYPKGLMDCYRTLEWMAESADEIHGDSAGIYVCGDSSGGNFTAAIALMSRDRKGPAICKQIMVYPFLIFQTEEPLESEKRYGSGYFLEYDSRTQPFRRYFDHEDDKYEAYASPILEKNLSSLPPAVFLSAECDPLLDQGLIYAKMLEDQGVNVEYHLYKGMIHGFLNRTYGKSFECLDMICKSICSK